MHHVTLSLIIIFTADSSTQIIITYENIRLEDNAIFPEVNASLNLRAMFEYTQDAERRKSASGIRRNSNRMEVWFGREVQ